MEKIRAEITNQNSDDLTKHKQDHTASDNIVPSHYLEQIEENLRIAEQHSQSGIREFAMLSFSRPIRWIAKLMSRIILYLAQVITYPQSNYNQSVLNSLRLSLEIINKLKNETAKLKNSYSYLNTSLALQERRLVKFVETLDKDIHGSIDQEQIDIFTEEKRHHLDTFYMAFEEQFRGTRKDIKKRLRIYTPYLKDIKVGTKEKLVLDVGCGRGEWLELLKEMDITASGVDINRVFVEKCNELSLNVKEKDVFEYLNTVDNNSLGAVTAFHFIEHLEFEDRIKFIDETIRVLKTGGIAIFETPNPENILVGSHNFYFDPTHMNPLPSKMMKFMAESRGLSRIEIIPLHPYDDEYKIKTDNSELAKRFNDYLYGPQDYALIGYKV